MSTRICFYEIELATIFYSKSNFLVFFATTVSTRYLTVSQFSKKRGLFKGRKKTNIWLVWHDSDQEEWPHIHFSTPRIHNALAEPQEGPEELSGPSCGYALTSTTLGHSSTKVTIWEASLCCLVKGFTVCLNFPLFQTFKKCSTAKNFSF